MAFFGIGKKRDDDEDFEDELELEEEGRKDRKLTRKFKDLSPENKRKRKEPPKPWGKKERFIILSILLFTMLASGILAIGTHNINFLKFQKPTFKSFSFSNLFGEDKIFLGGKKETDDTKPEEIRREFSNKVKSLSGSYALYFIEPETGVQVGVSETQKMKMGVLLKIPVLVALFKESEKGNIDLDKKTSSGKSLRELAGVLGSESGGSALTTIRNTLTDAKIESVLKEVGMDASLLKDGTVTPRDIGELLQKLWNGDILSQPSRDEILGYLSQTNYQNSFASGLPPEVTVAHIYGKDNRSINDAGVVMTQKPFIMVIMSQGVLADQANNVLPEIARTIYEIEK